MLNYELPPEPAEKAGSCRTLVFFYESNYEAVVKKKLLIFFIFHNFISIFFHNKISIYITLKGFNILALLIFMIVSNIFLIYWKQ